MLRPIEVALIAFAVAATPAQATERPLITLEVFSQVTREERDLKEEFRGLLQQEVNALGLKNDRKKKYFTLSASLIQLDSSSESGKIRSSARVSMVLKNERGAVQAILQGKATAEDTSATTQQIERGALEAAVQSAVKPLPNAVR